MNSQQAEITVTEYLKKLYGFALGKTANQQDAEDLAQEITLKLYSSLLKRDVDNMDAFVWRIAHNTLANYYRSKARRSIGIPIHELYETLPSSDDPVEKLIEAETIHKLQNEIAYLSKVQRRIIILYYYEGKRQNDISSMLGIPVGTVKWHLFNAKKEMKKGMETMRNVSELKFNPIKFTLMGLSGSVGTKGGTSEFFRNILSQNIAYCTYHEAKTINEIAECLGVSPVYVESEVEFLEEYGFLVKGDGKYLTNMIIDEPNDNIVEIVRLQEELYTKATQLISFDLIDELMNHVLLASDRIYYPDGDKNFLMWGLVLYLLAWSKEGYEEKYTFDEVATIRKDGGVNIAYAGIENEGGPLHKYMDSLKMMCGPMWNTLMNEHENILLWQLNSEWSSRDISLDNFNKDIERDLKLLNRFINGESLSVDEYTFMLQKGYIKKENEEFKLAIIWLKDEVMKEELIELCNKIRIKHKEVLQPLKEAYSNAVLKNIPRHLQRIQAYSMQHILYSDGWFLLYTMKELLACGKLNLPTKEQRKSLSMLIMQN